MARPVSIDDAQKRLQGQDRYIKNTPDTKPINRLWPAPDDLDAVSIEFHRRVGKLLVGAKVLTGLDRDAWFEGCRIIGHLSEINKILWHDGYTIGRDEQKKKHPVATYYNELLKQFQGFCSRFGLTPADRKKIDMQVDDNANDLARQFLFGNKK